MSETEVAAETLDAADGFEWCVVEIFGHRTHVGRSREEDRFGSRMMRVDALLCIGADGADTWQTFYYGGGSIFSYQPSTEDVVRRLAPRGLPRRAALAAPAEELGEYDIAHQDDDDDGFDD